MITSLRRLLALPMIVVLLLSWLPTTARINAQSSADPSATGAPAALSPRLHLPLIQSLPATISATITPQGGELVTPDQRVRLVFPAGAVAELVTVSFIWNDRAPGQGGLARLSSPFDLSARNARGDPITTFAQPLQIQLQLDDTGAQGALLYYYDTTQTDWVKLPSSFDTQRQRLNATTTHFTTFVAATATCDVGEGTGVPAAVSAAFLQVYAKYPNSMGLPLNCVHAWAQQFGILNWVQDFPDMPDWGKSVILWNPNQSAAYVVRGSILERYSATFDGEPSKGLNGPGSWLGAPISDEVTAPADLVSLDTGPGNQYPWTYGREAISYFERGYISTRHGEGVFAANTYPPALCNVQVTVQDAGGGRAQIQVASAVDRAPGWPTADQISDPIDAYFTVIFADGTKNWTQLNLTNKNTLSATIAPDAFSSPPPSPLPIPVPTPPNPAFTLKLGQTIHFYLDVYNRRGENIGWQPKLRTFPKEVANDSGWILPRNSIWPGTRDHLKQLTLLGGLTSSLPNDNGQCAGGSGPGGGGTGGDPGGGAAPKPFIYVALGDSYQSGEGVNSAPRDSTPTVFRSVYESDTYTDQFHPSGNTCHRALANYAKLNRNRLRPGAKIELIDVTCSGGTINSQSGAFKTIVGAVGSSLIDPASQIAEALKQLSAQGYTADDVDLITVGMGGNDAHFTDLIQACVIPSMLQEALRLHPNQSVRAAIGYVSSQLMTCKHLNELRSLKDTVIDVLTEGKTLAEKELWAQSKLLQTFRHAHILQLNYPNILPDKQNAPAWCSGVRKEDLDYAHGQATQINQIIADKVRASAQLDPRIELVDVQQAFGGNAICPASADAALVNGIEQANFDAEIDRLLDLAGNGDPESRRMLDKLAGDMIAWIECGRAILDFPFGICNIVDASSRLNTDTHDIMQYLNHQMDAIHPNMIAQPGSSQDDGMRYDRSQGLFHPNAHGQRIMADYVLAAANHTGLNAPLPAATQPSDLANGGVVGNAPISAGIGVQVHIQIGGFAANASVRIQLFSTPIDLGTVTSDANGLVDTTITLPAIGAGVHTIELQGDTPSGAGIHKQVRVNFPGRPVGEDAYTLYLTGFRPNLGDGTPPEQVDIIYSGLALETLTPDEDGGLFVELPLFDPLNRPDPLTIIARSQTSSTAITTTIDPIPSVVGLWATSTQPGALSISGSHATVNGRVHSNRDIDIHGSHATLTAGIEYGTTMNVTGSGYSLPFARQIAPGGVPIVWQIADYRPGGAQAVRAGASYHAIPATACSNGVWDVRADNVPSGIVYIPCAVTISGSNVTIAALLVAEGSIRIHGHAITVDPGTPGRPALLTAATGANALRIDGSSVDIRGTIQALDGDAQLMGANAAYRCGVIAQTIDISGSDNTIQVDEQCRVRQ